MNRHLPVTLLVSALAACGGAPKRAPAAPERDVTGPAAIAGTWLTSDDLDWSYRLVVADDGGYLLTIDRGKMGACEQKGTLGAATAGSMPLTVAKDTCAPEGTASPRALQVTSFTGDALRLRTLGADGEAPGPTRAYQREAAAAD